MLCMECDYNRGAHPLILKKMAERNGEPMPGYGLDACTERAAGLIREACGREEAQVYFLMGGTQTNAVVIGTMLRPYEGVIAADSGHISVHEAGAIEHAGHKVLTLPSHEGKLDPAEVRSYIRDFYEDGNHEHMVFPGMVYISHPTELGTLYSRGELEALSAVCRDYEIPLFLDGARLAYAIGSRESDVTLRDLADLTDVFYIGGTKAGALFGEAVVFPSGRAPERFMTSAKQRGAMLAKGWLLGLQFEVLFTDGLYEALGRNGCRMAERMKDILRRKGYRFYLDSPTNQQFIIVSEETAERLSRDLRFSFWERLDGDQVVIRLVTGWSTEEREVDELESLL